MATVLLLGVVDTLATAKSLGVDIDGVERSTSIYRMHNILMNIIVAIKIVRFYQLGIPVSRVWRRFFCPFESIKTLLS
jgi:hypothetical protein